MPHWLKDGARQGRNTSALQYRAILSRFSMALYPGSWKVLFSLLCSVYTTLFRHQATPSHDYSKLKARHVYDPLLTLPGSPLLTNTYISMLIDQIPLDMAPEFLNKLFSCASPYG